MSSKKETNIEKAYTTPAEKDVGTQDNSSHTSDQIVEIEAGATAIPDSMVSNKLLHWANILVRLTGAEARGIERVEESLRTAKVTVKGYIDMGLMWFSVNLTV